MWTVHDKEFDVRADVKRESVVMRSTSALTEQQRIMYNKLEDSFGNHIALRDSLRRVSQGLKNTKQGRAVLDEMAAETSFRNYVGQVLTVLLYNKEPQSQPSHSDLAYVVNYMTEHLGR